MTLRTVAMPADVPGQLWLSAMPGRMESWAEFEARAARANLSLVVCLTPRTEMQELAPAYHAAVAQGALPFRWQHLPMRNFGLPEDAAGFRDAIASIAADLQRGDGVMLHCAAGVGRTGTAAACVLKALGMSAPAALQQVRDAGSNPQNAQQSGLVDWF